MYAFRVDVSTAASVIGAVINVLQSFLSGSCETRRQSKRVFTKYVAKLGLPADKRNLSQKINLPKYAHSAVYYVCAEAFIPLDSAEIFLEKNFDFKLLEHSNCPRVPIGCFTQAKAPASDWPADCPEKAISDARCPADFF